MTLAVLGHALAAVHDLDTASKVTTQALVDRRRFGLGLDAKRWLDCYGGRAESAIERFGVSVELAPDAPPGVQQLCRPQPPPNFHARLC